MSLLLFKSLLRDELWVAIYPEKIVLKRISRELNRVFKPRVKDMQEVSLSQNISSNCQKVKDWVVLGNQLKLVLKDSRWARTKPKVIVSNHFAYYAVIPWNAELVTGVEQMAFVQHCFYTAYGDVAKEWNLQRGEVTYGKSVIASAIPINLLQLLQDVFAEKKMKLIAIYPQLILAINQLITLVKKQKTERSFWLAAIQNRRVCLMLVIDEEWRIVKNVIAEEDIQAQLSALVAREVVSHGVQQDIPVYLYWPELSEKESIRVANHKTKYVQAHPLERTNSKLTNRLLKWELA